MGDFGPNKTAVVVVQSVDGALFVVHQETQLFQVQLANFLIPGPITCFNHPNSTIIVANSNLEVECYRYVALQATSRNNIDAQKEAQQKEEGPAPQRIEPEWTCNLGEQPMLMVTHYNRYTETKEVLVSCEQSIFIITDKGGIRYQRRLDYTPSCLLTYHLDQHGADIYEDDERTKDSVLLQA